MMAPNREDHQPLFDEQKSHSIGLASILEHRLYHAEKLAWRALAVVAILSCFGNLLWAFQTLRATTNDATSRDRSFYAGLERDVPIPYHDDLIFNSPNRSLADAAWLSWVIDPGIVALPNDWVNGKMLPQAQHWPWDEDKGLYLLQGFHNMHCLRLIRKALLEAADGKALPAGHGLEHNLHCIESLRQDILCNADDTPRYTGSSEQKTPGLMQTRMCKSWDKLESWARDHTACYRDVGRDVKGYPETEKYKFCPEGYIFSATGSPVPPWVSGNGFAHPGHE